MIQTFTIQGRLDGLNEYTKACRTNRYAGSDMKKRNQLRVAEAILNHDLEPMESPVELYIEWFEKPNRGKIRDLDNVFFAVKFILDALVATKIIQDDGWNDVVGISNKGYRATDNPRIVVRIREV